MEKTVKISKYKKKDLDKNKLIFIEKSKAASFDSHAPYSKFHVGCSVLHEDGKIGEGSNQENASFPSGLCAERVALFESARNLERNKVLEIAVFARSTDYEVPKLLVPCAGCLQVISDLQNRQGSPIKVWMWDGGEDIYMAENASQFLPFHFELIKKKV